MLRSYYLTENAQQFGINPEAVGKMRNPMLVREIAAPADVGAARRLGSELNKNMTGALGTSERAVSSPAPAPDRCPQIRAATPIHTALLPPPGPTS